MISRAQTALAGVLVVQLALALATWSTVGKGLGAGVAAHPFLDIAAADVRRITVLGEPPKDGDTAPESVTLARSGEPGTDGWVVESAGGYPASTDKVEELLKKLLATTVRDPVATRAVNHDALNVGEREYARRITIETGDAHREIVMGNGPRSSAHVRFADEDTVYVARGISVWNVSAESRNYVDPAYVDVDRQKVTAITVENQHGRLTLAKGEAGWTLAESPASAEPDAGAIATLVNNLTHLTVQKPIGKAIKPEYGLTDGARVTLAWTDADSASALVYFVGSQADDRSYYAKADGNDYVVAIPKFVAEQALTKSAADFVKQAPAQGGG